MSEKNIMLTYHDILEIIAGKESHLLLWNWFNRWLWINTSYSAIFSKMITNSNWVYKDAKTIVDATDWDLELFIKKLGEDINPENIFLKKYVANKVKLDFIKAAHEIIREEIKNVYAEKNGWIYMLLKNFDNFFTLNYDSFLYLLLLNFKSSDTWINDTIALQSTIEFQEEELNISQNNIYTEIKEARKKWVLNINTWDDSISKNLRELPKTHFTTEIKQYNKTQKKWWSGVDIERVVNTLLQEEKDNKKLELVDDGARVLKLFEWDEFVFDINVETQNLFFLHWAFHIYKDWEHHKKITQTSNKALYTRLEEILNNEERETLCIFQAEDKLEEIQKSKYLMKSYNKLSELSGNVVLLWCSLSENDNHIYDKINESEVSEIFISSTERSLKSNTEKAKLLFPEKNITFFSAETISYESPSEPGQ